jgi:predicted DNA-binding transcriptional regulator AlpA
MSNPRSTPERSFERVREIAKRLSLSVSATYRILDKHRIPLYPIGLRARAALKSDIDRLINRIVERGPAPAHWTIRRAIAERQQRRANNVAPIALHKRKRMR